MPAEGVFENCPLDTAMATCQQRLGVMHTGGVQVVVIPASGASLSSLSTYAATASALGMRVMWEISNPGWWQQPLDGTGMAGAFPAFAAGCGCTENGPLLAFLAQWLGALPGTYGYYAADDSMLSDGDQQGVANYVGQIKAHDPTHTVMISSFGLGQAEQYEGIGDMTGQEIYPVKTTPLMPTSDYQSVWNTVASKATSTQEMADAAGKPSAFILQGFTWGDNLDDGVAAGACSSADTKPACYARLRYPSPQEQLQLRNTVLAKAHPKLILWWSFQGTYGDVTGDTYSMYPQGAEAAARWSGLAAAIQAPPPGANGSGDATAQAHAAGRHHPASRHRRHHRRRHRRHRHTNRRHHARRRHASRSGPASPSRITATP